MGALPIFAVPFSLLTCVLKFSPNCELHLTSFLRQGLIDKARSLSGLQILGVMSHSGYLTVDEQYSSKMFFWFFPAETGELSAPVLLWLNGGPGRPSTFGALLENGPLALNEKGKLERRKTSWTQSFSMLYIDNPVGVGYSYTSNVEGFSKNMNDTSKNLYNALVQFFQIFPEYRDSDFYVGGQSYACKYVAPLGCYIHERNTATDPRRWLKINFKGIYIGGGFCDPIGMMPAYFDFMYDHGVITDAQRQQLRGKTNEFINRTLSGKIKPSLHEQMYNVFHFKDTHLESHDHLVGPKATNTHLIPLQEAFLSNFFARMLLNAGFPRDEQTLLACHAIAPDFLTDTVSQHNFLIRHRYKVLHYSGNLDVIVNVPMTEAFLQRLDWPLDDPSGSGSADRSPPPDYRTASRKIWNLNNELAGWYTTVGKLYRVIIQGAGHMVPYDQPERTLDMMRRFVAGDFD